MGLYTKSVIKYISFSDKVTIYSLEMTLHYMCILQRVRSQPCDVYIEVKQTAMFFKFIVNEFDYPLLSRATNLHNLLNRFSSHKRRGILKQAVKERVAVVYFISLEN